MLKDAAGDGIGIFGLSQLGEDTLEGCLRHQDAQIGNLIAEKLLQEDGAGPRLAQMQDLNMLTCTEGKERTLSEYRRLLEEAGFDAWLAGSGAVVDAIFGTGFSGAAREPAAAAIDAINRCGAPVVACDIASGIDASTGEIEGIAIEADATVAFHAAKLGHFIAPGKWHTGELRVVPIGIPDGAPSEPAGGVIDSAVLGLAPKRGARSTKFTSGQVAIAGGDHAFGQAGRPSTTTTAEEIHAYAPEVIVLIPCGFYKEDILRQLPGANLPAGWVNLPAVRSGEVWATDATSYFSRPGPRVVEGVEILARILHPEIFGPPAGSQAPPAPRPIAASLPPKWSWVRAAYHLDSSETQAYYKV